MSTEAQGSDSDDEYLDTDFFHGERPSRPDTTEEMTVQ